MPTLERLGVAEVRAIAATFERLLDAHQDRINRLNVYPVPDGDTGTNMARTLAAVTAEIDALGPEAELEDVCQAISHGSLMGARGNSGVIVSQILRGIAGVLSTSAPVGPELAAAAVRAGATGAYAAVMKPVEGTILTVIRVAAEAAENAAADGATLVEVLEAAHRGAERALEETPELLEVLRDAGVVDAGGAGLLLLFDAALHIVEGRPLPEAPVGETTVAAPAVAHGGDEVAVNRYEVMFFLDAPDDRINDFKESWATLGDSIVVVGGDGLWNCHVHTDDVGGAIESAIEVGRPHRIRVTDLSEEVADEHERREALMATQRALVSTAVVAVSSGVGLTRLFRQFGVQEVVAGGQTLNPSTAELLAAVERAPSDTVIVLPNNKNIVPVAEQLDALTTKAVRVVPTRSMPEGLGALVVYDPEGTGDVNAAGMTAAAAQVRSGAVTRAVRPSSAGSGPIAEGDWLGIDRDEGIVAVDASIEHVVVGLLANLIDDEAGIVTVLAGEGSSDALTARIRAWVAQQRPGVEVEVHAGDQPLYPYLFGVE
jgi:fatty acid kinase